MNGDRGERLRKLVEEALRRDPEERAGFVGAECGGDLTLRDDVMARLAAGKTNPFDRQGQSPAAGSLDGSTLGPYIIRHEIGRGGMGIVYLAEDTRLSRRVALKALMPEISREQQQKERLKQEARAAAGLSHQGIATVYALEEIGTELYLTCEYVAGQNLRTRLKSGPVPIRQVVNIALQLARALASAHAQGIVHRDLKPENVILTASGVVKILDFGIARVEGMTSTLTQTGMIIGTPAYMSPEQARGTSVDFRTDMFSFGVLIYELASGSNPFSASTLTGTIARIVESEPPPLSHATSERFPALDRIVERCLRKAPSDRYRSTQDLVAELEVIDREPAAEVRPTASSRYTPRHWWLFHHLALSIIYIAMVFASWHARRWLPAPWGMAMLLAVLSCAAVGTTLRMHLRFTARFYPAGLSIQRERTSRWIRWCDAGFAACQLATGLFISGAHPEYAILFVTVALATAVSALVIEPATTAAAFRDERPANAAPV